MTSVLKNLASSTAVPTLQQEERALTIDEFCLLERISSSTYHKLKKLGRGPDEVRIPGLSFIRITAQARRDWHARIEQWRQEQAAELEQQRRSEHAAVAGRRAAQSANHVSKRRQRGER